MRSGPEESRQYQQAFLANYSTREKALTFFADDNVDKSVFSFAQLLRVASKNTQLARSLLSLQQQNPYHNYLSAASLAILGENEEIAHAILDDNEIESGLYDRLLGKEFYRDAYSKVKGIKRKEVKFFMELASHHQSVVDRILKSDFLSILERLQLIECAKAVKELAAHIVNNPMLFKKLTREGEIKIAEVNEGFAKWVLHNEKDLTGDELVRLSKVSAEMKDEILADNQRTKKFSLDNWVAIGRRDKRVAWYALVN